ncbi:hypothetical protein HanPSC8_Chr10g0406041 [Helianthus annuus]|nr:hypothetical protein HanPSC8_Chr10g0406041 [Helianthus annuus]
MLKLSTCTVHPGRHRYVQALQSSHRSIQIQIQKQYNYEPLCWNPFIIICWNEKVI